jgi:hypothetical protein
LSLEFPAHFLWKTANFGGGGILPTRWYAGGEHSAVQMIVP